MTTDELNAVADALLRELEAVEDSPEAPSWQRVLVKLALEGVHVQTSADVRRSDLR